MMPNGVRHVLRIVYVNPDGTEAGEYMVDPWATREQDDNQQTDFSAALASTEFRRPLLAQMHISGSRVSRQLDCRQANFRRPMNTLGATLHTRELMVDGLCTQLSN